VTDFASLGIKIDSTQAKAATADLDKLAAAGARAEGATLSFGKGARTAGVEAAAMAAQAQASARAAVGQTAGFTAVTSAVHGNTIAMRESLVISRELLSGNLTRLPGSLSILAQQFAISGKSASGFASQIAQAFGIIKVVQDAEIAGEAAAAAAAAAGIKSVAERAAANVAAADTEIELALAQKRLATTSAEAAVASERLAAGHADATAAAAELTVAENALAGAMEREAAAARAAAAATSIALGPMAAVLIGVGVAATGAALGFQAVKKSVGDSGVLENYARGLHLSAEQFDELKKKTNDFALTFGDVWNGIKKTYSDALDASPAWQKFKDGNESAFKAALNKAVNAAAMIGGFFIGAYRTIVQTFGNLPNALGSMFVSAVNAAIAEINKLMKASIDGINGLIDQANKLPLVNIGHLGTPQISAIKDNYAKAGAEAGKSFAQNVADATAQIQANARKGLASLWSNIIGAAEERIKDEAGKPPKGKKPNDHGLADALAELDAQIRGQLRLAAAYQVSDAAAIKAEALQKAEEEAIRHKGEVGVFYEKELALAVAKRAADGAKMIADIHAEAAARAVVNDQVEQGIVPVQRMTQALDEQQKKRSLMAALAVAEDKGMKDRASELREEIANLAFTQADLNDLIAKEAALRQTAANDDQIDRLKLEIELVGASNKVRAVRLAQLEAEQFIRDNAITDPKDKADVTKSYTDAAVLAVDLTAKQDNYNASLSYTADLLGLMDERAQNLAGTLSDAFGGVGDSIGGAITALSGFAATQAQIEQDRKEAMKAAGTDAAALAKVETLYAAKSANARMAATGQVISSLKGLFKEHSAGYKVMQAVERAYAIFQAVEAAAAIARDIAHTASTVANAGVRTTANTAEGGSKIFAQLGVWAFPVVAAMVAVLAALGAKGGGGGSSGAPPTSADDVQAGNGAGSVLGDSKAKSESIANSLKLVADNTNKDLEYSNQMLKSLRSIDTSISVLAGTVARQISVSGSLFDTSKLGLGTSGKGGFLGIGASQTTKSLYDLGLILNSASVADIIANGISGQTYQIVEKVKKKSGFLGIGGGTKTSYTTTNGTIDPEITDAIQGVILSLRDGLVSAAKIIGLDGAQAMLDGFQVNIGKVSFKDLTGQEIEDQLNAIFSKVGDQMAAAIFPTLATMQKVGEGLFETFIRVAKEYEAVDVALKSIGREFGAVGVGSIQARDALVQLFGGLDDFISATNEFRDDFLTDAEQIAPIQQSVTAELQRLGLAGITTRDQFKQAVLGLDLTTDAGRQMYASLLAVAPAFDKVLDYFDQLNKQAIQGFQQTIDQFSKFVDSLTKYRATLFATDAAQGNAYVALKAKFIATSALAATGDATALGSLEQGGKDFLTAAKNNASTLQQYLRDVSLVARGVDSGIAAAGHTVDVAQAQLDALQSQTSILQQISANTQATATALAQPVSAPPPSAANPTPTVADPVVVAQNQTIIEQNATIISNLDEMRRFWRRVEGDGLTVKTDDDTPLATVAA
jgi:hypothetical protein